MSKDELKLTDEQVDTLTNDIDVKALRTHFLTALTKYLQSERTEGAELVEETKNAYLTAHAELVQRVVDNPPVPKSVPLVNRKGFK